MANKMDKKKKTLMSPIMENEEKESKIKQD